MKLKALPKIVFSMEAPFSEAQVIDQLRKASQSNGKADDLDLAMNVDLYLENLVRYGILRQSGSMFDFRPFDFKPAAQRHAR